MIIAQRNPFYFPADSTQIKGFCVLFRNQFTKIALPLLSTRPVDRRPSRSVCSCPHSDIGYTKRPRWYGTSRTSLCPSLPCVVVGWFLMWYRPSTENSNTHTRCVDDKNPNQLHFDLTASVRSEKGVFLRWSCSDEDCLLFALGNPLRWPIRDGDWRLQQRAENTAAKEN